MNHLLHRMDIAIRISKARSEDYHTIFLEKQFKLLDRILKGEKYYASTFYIPGEIAALFDTPILYIERIAGFAAANRIIRGLNVRRIKLGMPECGCTYQLIFECLIDEKIIPPPAGFIAASFACDDAYMYCMAASSKYSVPGYFVDVMCMDDDESIQYLSVQLCNLYNSLKSQNEQIHSINEVVEISNATMSVKEKIDKLRFDYPGIMKSSDSFKLFTLYNDLGRSHALEIFTNLYQSLKQRAARYRQIQCPKLLWLGLIPLFNNGILTKTEERYSCHIVYEELFDFGNHYISTENFFTDLSKRIISQKFFSVSRRVNDVLKYIETMQVDGIVCFSQRNCRFLPPMLPMLRKRLENTGIPIVEIEGDAVDPEYFDESRYWNYMDVLFEMVYRRKKTCI